MLASLTCRLIVAPATAWRELAGPDAESRLPSPALLPAAVGGLSTLLSVIVCALSPGADFSSVLRATLAAIGGWVGAGAAAILFAPPLISASTAGSAADLWDPPRRATASVSQLVRYASVTSLPLAAGGLTSPLPQNPTLNIAVIAVLGLLAYRSGSLGARILLGLTGPQQRRAATVTALVSTLPALLAALFVRCAPNAPR